MPKEGKELVRYCIRHMSSKELIQPLLERHNIHYRSSDSYAKLADRFWETEKSTLDLDVLRKYHRNNWKPCPKDLHIRNLTSGHLKGHDWHGAMPSMLHLSLQDRVRECIDGRISIEQLVEIGADIMKHEYFMVAAHDLCETAIIEKFPEVIPPIGSRSISDFVFDGMPYDLKNTNYFGGLTRKRINANKERVVAQLLKGADIERLRKQAQRTLNNWGLNRFYVMVENQDAWLRDPVGITQELVDEASRLGPPLELKIQGLVIQAQIIAI